MGKKIGNSTEDYLANTHHKKKVDSGGVTGVHLKEKLFQAH